MGAPRRRWGLYGLAAAGAFVLSLALGIAWLVTTPGGARLLMDRLATAMGEGVKVTGVEGSLSDVLRVKLIEVHRPDLVIVIQDLLIERSPESAWFGRVSFKRVEAALIDVRTASSGAAARVPLTFEAPYALRVESTRVGELRIGTLTKDGNPPPPVIVRELVVLGGEGDKKSWRLEKGEAMTPWGRAGVAGSLATTRPFALDLRGEIAGEREGVPYRASARLGGTLEKIEATLEAEARALRLTGTALVEPFDKHPLRALKAQARDVDIAAFGGGPHSRFTVDADLSPSGDGFAGPVRLANALAGSLDAQKIPVASAEGRIAWMPVGETHELVVTDARLMLEGGGTAQGSARWMPGRLEAKVTLADVDTARIHARMRSTRVGGTISVVSEGGGQRFEVALADPQFKLEGHATLANARLEIPTIRVKHEGGAVEGKGFLGFAQRREFRFEGRAEHFDPSAFVGRVKGDLNFEFVASGALEPLVSGDVRLDIAQSRLAENAFVGNVHVAGDAQRIASAEVRVSLGDAQFQANGSFGRTGDAMQVALQAPNLGPLAKVLELEVSGKLDARGTLTGTFAAPGGRFEIAGANLGLPGGFYTTGLNARGEVATAADGKVDASIDGTTITHRSGDAVRTLADHATLTLQGTRTAHKATLVAALSKESELRASVRGGIDQKASRPAWRGELTALSLTGPSEFSLASPAPLALAADRVELGDATIKGSWGEARFALSRWTPELLELRGAASGVGVRNLARTLRLSTIPRGSLTIAAEWDVKAGDTVDGFVSISRVSGDLRIGEPPQPLGLEELKLRAEAIRGQAKIMVNLRSQLIGRLDGDASGKLQHTRAGFGIERETPIEGKVDAQVDSFAWAAAWMGPEARAEGKANAHMTISGTLAEPRWNGRVDADGVSIREPQSGFEVEKGVVAVTASDRSLVVEKFSASTPWRPSQPAIKAMEGFARPESGTLEASGSIDLRSRLGTVVIKATSVPVTQLNTRFLALSGDVKLEARAEDILATGTLRADAGWIGALATPLPSVSDDVVVVRKSVPAEDRKRERVRMDVRFSLGDHLSYTGRGLDTKLQGDLRIQGELGSALRGNGVIRTVAGTYDAYGRKLTIEHGTLTFFGSLENPALDVLALRKGLPVEAGVEVRGNVSRPRVRLVSSPDVPEQEKVSWLVLGRGPSDVSQSEAATLASAANAILGRTSGAQQITQQLGVDEVKVGRSEAASALGVMPQNTVAGRTGSGSASDVVTVGKKLTKDIYVAYERGLADAEDTLRITWQITHQFQMLVRAGYLPGIDAVYRWTFE